MTSIPSFVWEEAMQRKITTVNLGANQLSTLPAGLLLLQDVEILHLYGMDCV